MTTPGAGGATRWIVIVGVAVAGVVVAVAVFMFVAGNESDSGAVSDTTTTVTASSQSEASNGGGDGGGTTDDDASDADVDDDSTQAQAQAFAESPTGAAVHKIAPAYGADGSTAVNCIEQNMVGGFTADELSIIHSDPTAASWPPGLAEKFAAVLEACIPLEPFYLAQFGAYAFEDPDCVQVMTDHVLAAYSWTVFIRRGILDDDLYPALQAEFDAYVSAGYAAKGCFAA